MTDSPLVIFDLDGTIYKSEHSVVPAMQETCREFGLPEPPPERILELLALTRDEQLPYITGGREDIDLDDFVMRLEEREFELVREHAALFDGMLGVFRKLEADGFTLAVCSSGGAPYVNQVVDALGIRSCFSAVSGHERGEPKHQRAAQIAAEHAGPAAAVVGDAASDARAAVAVGVPLIVAAYGYSHSSIDEQVWTQSLVARTPGDVPGLVRESLERTASPG